VKENQWELGTLFPFSVRLGIAVAAGFGGAVAVVGLSS
jgi:hypothetical protein